MRWKQKKKIEFLPKKKVQLVRRNGERKNKTLQKWQFSFYTYVLHFFFAKKWFFFPFGMFRKKCRKESAANLVDEGNYNVCVFMKGHRNALCHKNTICNFINRKTKRTNRKRILFSSSSTVCACTHIHTPHTVHNLT